MYVDCVSAATIELQKASIAGCEFGAAVKIPMGDMRPLPECSHLNLSSSSTPYPAPC